MEKNLPTSSDNTVYIEIKQAQHNLNKIKEYEIKIL